jgi:hypothetical protein
LQVMIFISNANNDAPGPPSLLILPDAPRAVVPRHLQSANWTYFATTTSDDALIGATAEKVETDLAVDGYSVVKPTG